ncbi:MAG: trypsin-like peptidase domain-containing protein [Ktedonobacterales bacterium]|nr:trypsin-like peptidase domain-containing protein [Ktedonobacterales bacterium]
MSDTSPALIQHRPFRRHLTMATFALALTALVFSLALIRPLHAQGGSTHPGGNIQDPTVLNVDIARPAVVRILFAATNPTVTVQACASENTTFTDPFVVGGLGSGVFISSHGDILTASHVVKDEGGEFELQTVEDLQSKIIPDIQKHCGIAVPNIDTFLENNAQAFTFDFSHQLERVWFDTSYHGAYSGSNSLNVPSFASFKVTGIKDFITTRGFGDDVAVIHVDGISDSPSVAIGDSDAVSPTDRLTEIGYPGNGDNIHIDINTGRYKDIPQDFLTQSLNQLYVSAIKTNDEGGTLIQVGGNVEHGDSGGPALNAQGQVVGIASFGPTLSSADSFPAGTAFFQASNSAKSIIEGANIDTTPGTFQTKWRQALTDFAATSSGHWHKAVTDLTALQQAYPDFKGGDDYLTYAQNQATNESTLTSGLSGNSRYLIYGAVGLAVLVLVIVLITVAAGRSRRRNQTIREAVAVSATGYGVGQPPSANYSQGNQPQQNYPAQNYPSAPYGATPPPASYGPGRGPPPYSQGTPSYGQNDGPPYGNPPTPPAQFSNYTYPPQGQMAPPHTTCVNGHALQPNETYCRVCGAGRA